MKRLNGKLVALLVCEIIALQCTMGRGRTYAKEVNKVSPFVTEEVATLEATDKEDITAGIGLQFKKLGGYSIGKVSEDGGATEIVQFNKDNNKLYIINGLDKSLEIISLEDIVFNHVASSKKVVHLKEALESSGFLYGDVTSVAVNTEKDSIAVAVQHQTYSEAGKVVLLDYEGNIINTFEVGVQPDMVTFTPDGNYIISANEGEPRLGYSEIDPKGSVTIIDITKGIEKAHPKTLTFEAFENQREALIHKGVLLKKDSLVAEDLEPEYITVSEDGKEAYISLQEANAILTVDICGAKIKSIDGLGFKDHTKAGNGIDIVKDGKIHITSVSALSAYMPDTVASYKVGDKEYIITANEGDSRSYKAYENETKKYFKYTNQNQVVEVDKGEGEKVTVMDTEKVEGLEKNKTYLFGARSFSIWDKDTMMQVYDSGSDFEQITSRIIPEHFNVSNDDTTLESRSGKKGPEPEGLTVGKIGERQYAFILLERTSGMMVYDITDPSNAYFESYINTRDYSEAIKGDVSGEGIDFISEEESLTGKPLVVVAHEVSGTVTVYEVQTKEETEELDKPEEVEDISKK